MKEAWANGQFTAAFDIEMMAKNAGATGAASALQELVDLDYETLNAETSNE